MRRENLEIDLMFLVSSANPSPCGIHESIKSGWQWILMLALALAADSMMEKPISFDTQGATPLIWSFIFSSGFHALIVSRTQLHATIRAENEDFWCIFALANESNVTVGWVRERCVYLSRFGRWAWWWKFHRWTLCAKHIIILIMVEKPTSGPGSSAIFAERENVIRHAGAAASQGQLLQEWRGKKGFSFFWNSERQMTRLQVS